MKKRLLFLLVCGAGWLLWWQRDPIPPPSDLVPVASSTPPLQDFSKAPRLDTNPLRAALLPPEPAGVDPIPPHPEAQLFGTGTLPPEEELQMLHGFFQLYREQFGSFPTGENNAQFMHALRGNNPDRWGIFPGQHPRLNPAGELLDPWGTPYIFHSLSSQRLELRSAGPDREIYTSDDLLR